MNLRGKNDNTFKHCKRMRRKERAQKIADTQEFLEKRHRLLHVLVQKLLLNHGPRSNQGLSKAQITDTVTSFLEKSPSLVNAINIRDINDLESQLSRELQNVQPIKTEEKMPSSTKRIDVDVVDSKGQFDGNGNSSSQLVSSISHKENCVDINKVNPWSLIETFQIVENEHLIEEKKVKAEQKQKDMAKALHEQIRIKKDAVQKEKAEDDKFLAIQRNAIKEWEEEKVLSSQIEQQKIAELKKVRHQQVEETERRRKAEQQEKISRELKEIEDIKIALEMEEEEKHRKKQLELEKWERITAENSRKLEQRRLQKEVEAKMDAKLMEEMKKKYDEEGRKRAKALEDRKVKLELNGELLKEAGAFGKREETIKFEKMLLEAAEARERAQALREKEKHDEERKKIQLITESNKQMADERKQHEKEIEKENEEYALKCLKEKEELLREEEHDRIKEHETKEKYRTILQQQIDEQKKCNAHFDGMTIVERSMNKKLMNKLENSDVKKMVFDKVMSANKIPNIDEITTM